MKPPFKQFRVDQTAVPPGKKAPRYLGAWLPPVPRCETPDCPNFVESGEAKCTDCLDKDPAP